MLVLRLDSFVFRVFLHMQFLLKVSRFYWVVIPILFLILGGISCDSQGDNALIGQEISERKVKEKPLKTTWHFSKDYTNAEKQRIKKWLRFNLRSVYSVLGEYPFRVHFYLKKYEDASEPAPWAHTIRNKDQGVEFYLCLKYPDSLFYCDWTAPHEISHLSLPFLGKENSWFAEGYATYMQEQVLLQMGYHDSLSLGKEYKLRFDKIAPQFDTTLTMIQNFKDLKAHHNFPAFYWGGAYYFYVVDKQLAAVNSSLSKVIKLYQKDCRNKNQDFNQLIISLDSLSGTAFFTEELIKFRSHSSGFFVEE